MKLQSAAAGMHPSVTADQAGDSNAFDGANRNPLAIAQALPEVDAVVELKGSDADVS